MLIKDKILNEDVLKTLKELDDGVFFSELIQLFLDNVPPLLQAMHLALSEGDVKALHVSAHKLKGSCGNVGADHMAELARCLESSGRAGGSGRPLPLSLHLKFPERHDPQAILALLEQEFISVTAALQKEVEQQKRAHLHRISAAPGSLH